MGFYRCLGLIDPMDRIGKTYERSIPPLYIFANVMTPM